MPLLCWIRSEALFFFGFVAPLLHVRRREQRRFIHGFHLILARLLEKLSQEPFRFAAVVGKAVGSFFRVFLQRFLGRKYLSCFIVAATGIDHIHYIKVSALQTLWWQLVECHMAI